MDDNKQKEWESSYRNRDNFVFYPHEEVIRFVSRKIRKKIGVAEFRDVIPDAQRARIIDVGCGIGRHVVYCHEMGLEAYGIDLSATAVQVAIAWAAEKGLREPERKIRQGDIRELPWDDGYFDFAVSHGVLDSMPFDIARAACVELARKMRSGGLFYCDLISGDDSRHAREFAGEEVVSTPHERDTIQLYFNMPTIRALIADLFAIDECILIRREDVVRGGYASRYHLTLQKP